MWGNFSPVGVAGAESPPSEEQNPITPHPSCLCPASGGVVEAEGKAGGMGWWWSGSSTLGGRWWSG